MAKTLSTIDVSTDTFSVLFAQVNSVIDTLATEIVTANNEANGALTTGNAYVNGIMSSVTFAANTIRGGNVQSSQPITIASNVVVSGTRLQVGNSTINAVANSSTLKFSNASSNLTITIPTAAQVSGGGYALLANGTWANVLTSANAQWYFNKETFFQQNVTFNSSNVTFASNVTLLANMGVEQVYCNTVSVNGAVFTGNSTTLIVDTDLAINGSISYASLTVNSQSISANSSSFIFQANRRLIANSMSLNGGNTSYNLSLRNGQAFIEATNSSFQAIMRFHRADSNASAWIGIPSADPDALYLYGPGTSPGDAPEAIAHYTQDNWYWWTSNTARMNLDESGRLALGHSNPTRTIHVINAVSDPTIRLEGGDGHYIDIINDISANAFLIDVFGTGATDLTIDRSGNWITAPGSTANVGIGLSTVSDAKLRVEGITRVGHTNNITADVLHMRKFSTDLVFRYANGSSGGVSRYEMRSTTGGSGSLFMSFATVSGNPRVGINTTTPNATLDVVGTVSVAKADILNQTLSDGATINWNTALGQVATITLGGNRTMANPSNLKVGTLILHVKQDGTGNRTLSWGSAFKWPGGVAPTLSTGANDHDVFSFICDGVNLYGSFLPDVS